MKKLFAICALISLFGFNSFAIANEDVKGYKASSLQNSKAHQAHSLSDHICLVASVKLGYDSFDLDRDADASYAKQMKESDSLFVYGPAVIATYKQKYYAGISYLGGKSAEYNHELDIMAGYSFTPKISVFLSYKYLQFHAELDKKEDGNITWESGEEEWKYTGPMIGVDLNYPFRHTGFILFGTIGYAFLNFEMDNSFKAVDQNGYVHVSDDGLKSDSEKANGPAFDIGGSYSLRSLPQLSFTGQFKYQNYSSENDWKTVNMGYIFGINYLF